MLGRGGLHVVTVVTSQVETRQTFVEFIQAAFSEFDRASKVVPMLGLQGRRLLCLILVLVSFFFHIYLN